MLGVTLDCGDIRQQRRGQTSAVGAVRAGDQLGIANNHVEGGAQLVADVSDELDFAMRASSARS